MRLLDAPVHRCFLRQRRYCLHGRWRRFTCGLSGSHTERTRPGFAIIAVSEVDSRLLVAVPETAWHRTVSKRLLPRGALQKPVCVNDRSVPLPGEQLKVWLGLLKEELEGLVQYDLQAYDVGFAIGEGGYTCLSLLLGPL